MILLPNGISEDVAIAEHIDSGCKMHVKAAVEKQRRTETRCCYGKGKKKCKDKSLIKVTCDGCQQLFCVKHRAKSVHKCQGPVQAVTCRPCPPAPAASAPTKLVRKLSQDLVRVASQSSLSQSCSPISGHKSNGMDHQNACPVCTFLNPPTATQCEMCNNHLIVKLTPNAVISSPTPQAEGLAKHLQAALKALDDKEAKEIARIRVEFNQRRARLIGNQQFIK